jgi:hypothetical protein
MCIYIFFSHAKVRAVTKYGTVIVTFYWNNPIISDTIQNLYIYLPYNAVFSSHFFLIHFAAVAAVDGGERVCSVIYLNF